MLEEHRFPEIKGKVCRVLPYSIKFAKTQSKDESVDKSCSIFVKGFLKAKWTHAELFKHFEKFGKIVSAKVSIDNHHNSKGYGYVQFTKEAEATQAIKEVKSMSLLLI